MFLYSRTSSQNFKATYPQIITSQSYFSVAFELSNVSVCMFGTFICYTRGGGLPYKDRGANHTGKIVVLGHPGVSILKKSIAGALAVHFWVLSKKMQCEFLCCFRIGTSRGEKKSHPQNRILVPFFKVIPLK